MIAYAYLQFSDMSDAERELYRQALLRYCELDTMAMVMIWEYWKNEISKKWNNVKKRIFKPRNSSRDYRMG